MIPRASAMSRAAMSSKVMGFPLLILRSHVDRQVRFMAGHSKWANIRHRKAAQDAKKSKVYTKVSREIFIAAKNGGSDPADNPRLRDALEWAKSMSCPKDLVKNALQRAENPKEASALEAVTYEGTGPHGSFFIVEALTDNRKRTAPIMRHVFNKHGGSLGQTGSSAWMFEPAGFVWVASRDAKALQHDEEAIDNKTYAPLSDDDASELLTIAIGHDAEDLNIEGPDGVIACPPTQVDALRKAVEAEDFLVLRTERTLLASHPVELDIAQQRDVESLLDELEDQEDVQKVFHNVSFTHEEESNE